MLELTEEQNLFSAGYKLIAGIDEAGRWPLAAYNAGPAYVRLAGGIPDIKETKNYVTQVLKYKNLYDQLI